MVYPNHLIFMKIFSVMHLIITPVSLSAEMEALAKRVNNPETLDDDLLAVVLENASFEIMRQMDKERMEQIKKAILE